MALCGRRTPASADLQMGASTTSCRFTYMLTSVVCHRGHEADSGHYWTVALSRQRGQGPVFFIKMDDKGVRSSDSTRACVCVLLSASVVVTPQCISSVLFVGQHAHHTHFPSTAPHV